MDRVLYVWRNPASLRTTGGRIQSSLWYLGALSLHVPPVGMNKSLFPTVFTPADHNPPSAADANRSSVCWSKVLFPAGFSLSHICHRRNQIKDSIARAELFKPLRDNRRLNGWVFQSSQTVKNLIILVFLETEVFDVLFRLV